MRDERENHFYRESCERSLMLSNLKNKAPGQRVGGRRNKNFHGFWCTQFMVD